MDRSSGVLMHVSSLHGNYSVGSFGKEALEFVDFLSDCGFSYWQVLPFCMTDEYNSPYKSLSSFGANPLFIDLEALNKKGLITDGELLLARQSSPYLCEYDRLGKERLPLLRRAAARTDKSMREKVADFISQNPPLAKAAEFLALREANGGALWTDWTVTSPDKAELYFWQFVQY